MRQAAVNDSWRAIKKGKGLPVYLKRLQFENVENIKSGNISFSFGINAICGANGVGKSTILEGINYVLTCGKCEEKLGVFLKSKLSLEMFFRGSDKCCDSTSTEVKSWFDSESMIKYIPTGSSVNCMARFKREENVEEYFDSTEEEIFNKADLEFVSRIVGKQYESCRAYMIEEIMDYESMPFFIVKSNGVEYNTINMGVGEHQVIYIYYFLKNMKNSIILLEEPESFIPPYSQRIFTRMISKLCLDNKLNIILTTHSNHILEEIPEENITILRKNPMSHDLLIDSAIEQSYLRPLGLQNKVTGYLLLEDLVGKLFCNSIIKIMKPEIHNKFKCIIVTGGASEISTIMNSYKSSEYEFEIIGIYDGDMNNETMYKELSIDKHKWKHTYLPYLQAVEDVFRELLNSQEGLEICKRLNKNQEEFIRVLADTQMYEKHDWIHEVSRGLNTHIETLVDAIVSYLVLRDTAEYENFIGNLELLTKEINY